MTNLPGPSCRVEIRVKKSDWLKADNDWLLGTVCSVLAGGILLVKPHCSTLMLTMPIRLIYLARTAVL